MIKKTLLLGASGLLGRELHRELAGSLHLIAPSKHVLNVTDYAALRSYIEKHQPEIIVNAVGLTGLQRNDEKPELGKALNAELPAILAEQAAKQANCKLIHFSTVDVYGDTHNMAVSKVYTEESSLKPVTLYAQSKLEGEEAIQNACDDYLIFRLSALYDQRQMYDTSSRDPIMLGAPTSAQYVANTVARSINRIERRVIRVHPGVYNLSSKGDADWQAFAREVVEQREKMRVLEPAKGLVSIGPRLSVDRVEDTFCLFLPTWQALLKSALAERSKAAS